MASESSSGLGQGYAGVEQIYEFAQTCDPASNHDELDTALLLHESTITAAIQKAGEEIDAYRATPRRRAATILRQHRADMAEGAELAQLALDATFGAPEAVDSILEGPLQIQARPELLRWLQIEVRNSGYQQAHIADMMGISPSTMSRLMAGKQDMISEAHVLGAVNALGILLGKSHDDRRKDQSTAASKYQAYFTTLQTWRPEPKEEERELPPPLSNMETLVPVAGRIGATIMEGLGVVSGSTGRFSPAKWELAMRAVRGHRATLLSQFRLLKLSVSVVGNEPGAVERLVDPTLDYPLIIRRLNRDAEAAGMTQTEIARRAKLNTWAVSRILGNKAPLSRDYALNILLALAAKQGLSGESLDAYVNNSMALYDNPEAPEEASSQGDNK